MKRVLLLGYSYIAQKAIIPALENHPKLKLVGIASKTKHSEITIDCPVYADYLEAIEKSNCDTVYISLHNCAHFPWIIKCLEKNKNVICDKPVVMSKAEAKKCYKKAGTKLIIFESLPYLYHTQHKELKRILHQGNCPPQHISVQFGFPPLNDGNFRNDSEMGGGCLYDLGPYLASVGLYYFDTKPETVNCIAYLNKNLNVPTSAYVTMDFDKNKSLYGYISFEMEYRNHLDLWGRDFFAALDRSFTTPKDFINCIYFKSKDVVKNVSISPCDSFKEMFDVYANIKPSSYRKYNKDFLNRAFILDGINKSAISGQKVKINYEN